MDREKNIKALRLSLVGAVLTLIGDFLIGGTEFPAGASMIEGYLAAALTYPAWRPIAGGLIGLLGISLELPGLMTVKQNAIRKFRCSRLPGKLLSDFQYKSRVTDVGCAAAIFDSENHVANAPHSSVLRDRKLYRQSVCLG